MRKILLLLITASLLLATPVFAQERIIEPPLMPMSPEVMGQGGTFMANAHGYNALFHNPAGFAAPDGDLTLLSTSTWVYARPDRAFTLLESMANGNGNPDFIGEIEQQITTGGAGFGTSAGFALVGRSLGLGLVTVVDSYLHGAPFPLGTEGYAVGTVAAIGGLAFPVRLLGIDLKVGADLRPMVRLHAPLDSKVALDLVGALSGEGDILGALGAASAYVGSALAIDLGATAQIGPLRAALSIRDFAGTRFNYTQTTVNDVQSGGFNTGSEITDDVVFITPMNISLGAAFDPKFGGALIDPVVHVSLDDVVGVIRDDRTPWTLLHAGIEMELLRIFSLWGGLNQGYLTVGGGVDLLFLEVSAAAFTRELGRHIGDQPNSGVSLEVALRF